MADFIQFAILIAVLCFPFVMMPLLWRRMKRVQAAGNAGRPTEPARPAWEEPLEQDGDITLSRRHAPNQELIDLGDRAQHARWPLNND